VPARLETGTSHGASIVLFLGPADDSQEIVHQLNALSEVLNEARGGLRTPPAQPPPLADVERWPSPDKLRVTTTVQNWWKEQGVLPAQGELPPMASGDDDEAVQ
jgi:hypothetical protein